LAINVTLLDKHTIADNYLLSLYFYLDKFFKYRIWTYEYMMNFLVHLNRNA